MHLLTATQKKQESKGEIRLKMSSGNTMLTEDIIIEKQDTAENKGKNTEFIPIITDAVYAAVCNYTKWCFSE